MRHAPSHELTLLQGSQAYFPALVQAMAAAQDEILFETYLFDFSAGSQAKTCAFASSLDLIMRVSRLSVKAATSVTVPNTLAACTLVACFASGSMMTCTRE